MKIVSVNNVGNQIISKDEVVISHGNFIEANTERVALEHLKNDCIIPVYSDNESTIAHFEFIEATQEVLKENFSETKILEPDIRISHIIKGRVPTAIGKPVKELLPEEQTIYYQRCAFMIEMPEIKHIVNGNPISLSVGGVRALNQENLYSKRSVEKFKVFIGFKNLVCCNLCISTDGLNSEIKVTSLGELKEQIQVLFNSFDQKRFLGNMERMSKFYLDETQFAHTIGKMRMFQHLSKEERQDIFPLSINDNQIGNVVKEYYSDPNFSRSKENHINLWSFYNLMTSANKSTYIDSNLNKNVCAYEFIQNLANSMQTETPNWFLN
tara:strand:- start:8830 stop:9804 length:975 start_codon:yes stop_codon:yes gene_type:complete